jgi:hypothetical protein
MTQLAFSTTCACGGDRWYALLPSEHYGQFGARSLRRLIERSGLRVVHYERGCTPYWGSVSRSPKRMARWFVFRSVALRGRAISSTTSLNAEMHTFQ